MTGHTCSCGYEADAPVDLADHLGEAFIPLTDDIGTDGSTHAEQARGANSPGPATLTCLCGLTVPDASELDEHLLGAFTPADGTGLDGHRHVPARAA